MLGKLFQYECKALSKILVTIHGFVLLFAIIGRLFLEINGGLEQALSTEQPAIINFIAGLIIFFIIVFISCTAIINYIAIGYRFYKNVFTEQGYLTNTLPVTPTQIILSKGMTAFLWMILDVFLLILSCCILFLKVSYIQALLNNTGFAVFMDAVKSLPIYFWLVLIVLAIAAIINSVLQLYFSTAIGNLFSSHKIAAAVGAYFIITVIVQIIYTTLTGLLGNLAYDPIVFEVDGVDGMTITLANVSSLFMLYTLIILVIFLVLYYIGTRYIMTKKLNLQ